MHQLPSWVAIVIIGREIVITGIRLVASAQGIALAADKYGKYKLILQVAAIAVVLLRDYPFVLITNLPIGMVMMTAAIVMTIFSGYNYVRNNYKRLRLQF